MIRLNIKTTEDLDLNLFEVENYAKDKVANPGEVIKIKKHKNPFIGQEIGTAREFHQNLQRKSGFEVENTGQIASIINTFRDEMSNDKEQRIIKPSEYVERLAQLDYRTTGHSLEMLFEEDKVMVETAIDQKFFGNRQGCGLKNIEPSGW